ncbi:MAG: hypothetical protein E7321_00935 [Clostridiales bacterium]|nr:hypothetical protein [Clostridiales bacterium]
MNAAAAFANREQQLLAQLEEARDMDQAISLCSMALEQVACELAQDEQDEHARQRQLAVLAAVRRAPQLLRAARAKGELVLSANAAAPSTQTDKLRRIAGGAGAFLLAALAVYELIDGQTIFALLQLSGAVLLSIGSRGKKADPLQAQARGVSTADAHTLVRTLRELCQAVDICVSDLMLLEKDAGLARISGTADEAMLDLLTTLMEAKNSGRDDLAMKSLSQAEQYLHLLGVELIGYSVENAQLFDILPTMGESRTIRPAMMQDGKVLRRGVAALQAGRSMGA